MMVEVLQLGSDAGSSLYQIQVDGKVDGELFMTPYDDQTAEVRLFNLAHTILGQILVRVVGDNWLNEARHRVADKLLKKSYGSNIEVKWYTRGARNDA